MRPGGLIRNFSVGLLIVLASVTFGLTAVAGWTHQTVIGTDRFISVVTDATSNPEVIDSLGDRLADQIVDRLGLEQRIQNLLPPALDRLADPVTQAVHDRIATAATKLLSDPAFQVHFAELLSRLHDGLLNVVNGDSQYFTTTNGKLTLDLLAVMDTIVVQLGGPQTEPFIMHPAEWSIDKPIVGAEDVYKQIRRWLSGLGIELGPAENAPNLQPNSSRLRRLLANPPDSIRHVS